MLIVSMMRLSPSVLVTELNPPKVEYSLTELGETLIPVISVIGQWGDEHLERLRNLVLKKLGHLTID